MAELDTVEKATAYLARIEPNRTFRLYPFEMGWVCTPILTPEENAAGMSLGSTKLVIDSETAVVREFPSWPVPRVIQVYTEARRSGQLRGRQIYPYRWRITMRRLREDTETIEYQMVVVSLANPPEPSQEHGLTINKATFLFTPTDTLSATAASKAARSRRENQGIWPEEATTEL